MTAPTFAKTHNLIAFLAKPAESEGFEQIIDFLNGSSVRYVLTTSPTIRTSCIKQFWSTTKVKRVNDEVRVQALIDVNRVNIKEYSIRRTLKLDDEEGISCLASDEVFTVLKPPPGLNLAGLWHKQSSILPQTRSLTSQVDHQLGDMSHYQEIYDNLSLTKKVFANMRRVCIGFSRVITPLFENMLVPAGEKVGQAQDDVSIPTKPSTSKPHKKHKSKKQQPITPKVPSLVPSPEQQLPSPSNDLILDADKDKKIENLKDRVHKLEEENLILKEKSFKSAKIDTATPVEDKEESFKYGRMIVDMDEYVEEIDEEEPANVEEVLKVVTIAKLMTEVVTTAEPTTTIAQVPQASALSNRRGVVIEDPEETAASIIMHIKNDVLEQVKRSERQNNAAMSFLERVEEEVTVQEKEIKEEGNKRQGESLEQEIAKKQRIDKEAEKLKRHLQIVANDDNDDVEDVETLWKLVKERFETTEPKNFSDDFLLNILKIMFEKPNIEAYKYPLTHFTLEQMLNNVRLEVKEESKMSLELLRLVKRQLNEGYVPE
nr:hypothetical protein [Tanacetum cinerariifolium]